jgi:uncharacterized lipoprotein YmbA
MNERLKRGNAYRAILMIAGLALCTGCLGRSPDVRHFMLGTSNLESTGALAPDITALAVLVGPVRLPAYLDRPQMATLENDGEVVLDEFDRWLGGFEENFLRALSLGLAQELGSVRVVGHPSKAPFPIDYQIRLHVDDLIYVAGGGLRVHVRWALVPVREETSPGLFVMDELIPVNGNSVEDIVRAHEEAVMALVRRMTSELVARATEG